MRNDKATVKKGRPILLIAIAVIVLMGALLVSCGKQSAQEPTEITAPTELPKEATVTDEQTLRELLLTEGEMTICVDEDMEVDQQFIVKGTKTLTGDAVIRMSLSAEWYQSLLVVSEGATLHMDGLVLDGNYIADGIHMEENANLVYLSGKIWRTDVYGIQAMGNVSIQNVNIEKAEYIGIYAKKGSKVTIEGGSLSDTATHDIYVDSEATVDIIGNARFNDCMGDSVINYGTLNVYDGTFSGATSYTFNNYGVMNIDYAGAKANGYVECSGSRLGVVCTRTNAQTNINRLHVDETTRQAVVTVGGKTVITDSLFEKTGYHAIEIQAGEAEIADVTVNEAGDAGLEIYTKGVVSVKDFTVNSAEGIGITCRGGKITGSNISIANTGRYGISCGSSTNGTTAGMASVSDIVLTDTGRSGAYAYGGATMELKNAEITGSGSRGIYIAEESKCTLSGDSIVTGSDYRGVEVRGTFTMESGSICRNYVSESGAGVYVSPKGYFVMNGGAIFNNRSGLRGGGICVTEGKVTINAGNVYNNMAANNGGGLYAQKGAQVTLRTGSIRNNKSNIYGDGIYVVSDATKLTMSGDFYLGGNDAKIDSVKVFMTVTRNGLSRHSASDPLLLTPNYSAPEGTVLATFNSASIAKAALAATKSGDGSYNIVQDGKNLVVAYATADMDMTDADTVYVSNFQQLKAAVESTTSKRNIILNSDIVFPERIRLPGGVTIRIQDDGTPRSLTRANEFTDNLFVTHYGTGLYLEGTQQGNLILDGTSAAAETVQSLVRTAGSTVIRNAVLRNNGVASADGDVRGALFRQLYGDFKIFDSVLTGGACNTGGAIMIDKGAGYIEGTTLSNNTSVIGGGAIRAAANTELEVVDSAFDKNNAGSSGGAIVAVSGAKVKVTDTKFADNFATTAGGVVHMQDEGTSVEFVGTSAQKAVIANNSAVKGGAFNVAAKTQLTVTGYIITTNQATKGTAVYNSGDLTVKNTVFKENAAGNEGGAVYAAAESNTTAQQCEFIGNSGLTGGGAIYVEANATVITMDSAFNVNTSESNGGAVHSKGIYVDTNSSYTGNSGKNGGAVAVLGGGSATLTGIDANAVFSGNSATVNGSAVFINSGNCTGTVENYTFTDNTTGTGAVNVVSTGKGTLKNVTFSGDTDQNAIANGELTINNVTGMTLVQGSNVAGTSIGKIYIAGFETGNQLMVKPYKYEGGHQVLWKADEIEDSVFAAACAAVSVAKDDAGNTWSLGEDGTLKGIAVARIGSSTFSSLDAAIAYANKNGGTGDTADMTIELLTNVAMTARMTISKNIAIVNASGTNITISRASGFVDDMFYVTAGKLTLGTNDTAETGRLVVDGTSANTISKRILDNRAGATFVLARNAVLENSNSNQWGAALVNRGTADLYGTIRNNVCTGAGGAVLQIAAANTLTIYEGSYTGNRGTRAKDCFGGFLRAEGSTVEIKGGIFADNSATHRGGALYFAGTANATITGGTFTDNTSGDGSAIYILTDANVSLKNAALNAQQIQVEGSVSVNNVTGATIVQGENGVIYAASITVANQLTVKPYKYEGGHQVLWKPEGIEDSVFAAACAAICVAPDPTAWIVTASGTLQGIAAWVGDQSFSSFASALEYANTVENATIVLNSNLSLAQKAVITKNITITCKAGNEVIVSRNFESDDMFQVVAGATLTLGTVDGGTLIINGASESAIGYRTVNNAGQFVLTAKASLVNANSTLNGAALYNNGTAVLSGDVTGNKVGGGKSGKGGALYCEANSTTAISGGTYSGNEAKQGGAIYVLGSLSANGTVFSANKSNGAEGGAIYVDATKNVSLTGCAFNGNYGSTAGAIYVVAGGKVECENGSFTGNTSPGNGGAVHVKGTYIDTNSSYTNNSGKNGGAVAVLGGGSATFTGTNTNAIFSGNSATTRGSAIFVNSGGCSASAIGYTFTGNTTGDSAVYIVSGGSGVLKNDVFSGETAQKITVAGTLEYWNITGASIEGTGTKTEKE